MRLSTFLINVTAFAAAAGLSFVVAQFTVQQIQDRSETHIRTALDRAGAPWAEVEADGLTVRLAGIAPTEAERFAALLTVGTVVDAARVIDEMQVAATAALIVPEFSAEILRNDAGISIIGLMPASADRSAIIAHFTDLSGRDQSVTDLIEIADFPEPRGWDDALGYAMAAIDSLPRAKVSVSAGRVEITAISDSARDKTRLEQRLTRAAPPGLRLSLNISAPRPVITPFTLRFVKDAQGGRFDACSADSTRAEAQIIEAATEAGLTGPARCVVGLGVPTPRWGDAVVAGIGAVASLGAGSVTFSDADITLLAAEGIDQQHFDRVVGELEATLPEVFALYAKLPETVDPDVGPPEFTATLSPEGQVQLRGRLSDASLRRVADSYAKSRFGSENVYTAARIVEGLPTDWPTRVLSALEALSNLSNGVVRVTPSIVSISGASSEEGASARIATLLADKLGEAEIYEINVLYRKKVEPIVALPTPEECEAQIGEILQENKIAFEPGSATINTSALGTMDEIAEVLRDCGALRLEIQGHTDSQGREEMNLNLSQARAQSVLNELRARRVRTVNFVAQGYGEAEPVADNETDAGREANRRIEFKLIQVSNPQADESGAEGADEQFATNDEEEDQ